MISWSKTFRAEEKAILTLQSLYEGFGYQKYKVSQFEEYGFYLAYKSFLQSEKILSFTDLDGRVMALKPDITLSIIKNTDDDTTLKKVYYHETVFRESAQSNTYREINQMGLEYIGTIDDYAVCETVLLAQKSLQEISEDYVLELSHMGFVMGFLESLALTDSAKESMLAFLSAKSVHEMCQLAKEQGVSEENIERLNTICNLSGDFVTALPKAKNMCCNAAMHHAIRELEQVEFALKNTKKTAVRLDFTLVNNTEFYDGILLAGYISGLARPVLSGGRYDIMMKKLAKKGGAIGFAVYLSELEYLRRPQADTGADVVIVNQSKDSAQLLCEVENLVKQGKSVVVVSQENADKKGNIKYRFTEGGLEPC